MGPDSGTAEDLADFAHQLFFSLDVYRQKTKKNFGARVGIHSEIIPAEIANEVNIREIWSTMINAAYKLVYFTTLNVIGDSC
jgi:hypothetical protein